MWFNKVISKKIITFSILILVLGLIASALISPVVKKFVENNWDDKVKEYTFNFSEKVQDAFDKKNKQLLNFADMVQVKLKKGNFNSTLFNETQPDFIDSLEYSAVSFELFDNDNKLLVWNNDADLLSLNSAIPLIYNESFFYEYKLNELLILIKQLDKDGKTYNLLCYSTIDKRIKANKAEGDLTFIDSLKQTLKSEVDFVFSPDARINRDGRKYSFPILNNFKNKIGVATISKLTLSYDLKNLDKYFILIQSVIVILIVLLLFVYLQKKYLKSKNLLLRFLIFSATIIGVRIILFLSEIPSGFIDISLTEASYFSSRFAYGMVRSPAEFFITALSLLSISIYFLSIIKNKMGEYSVNNKNIFASLFYSSFIILFVFLLWRAFGASMRSVIFDSSIRYFKEFTLYPSLPLLVMSINILLLGSIIIISSVGLIILLVKNMNLLNYRNKLLFYFSLFLVLQVSGFIFDLSQTQPQGTHLIRFVFISFIILSVYVLLENKGNILTKLVLYSIAASISSVSLLTYYNSQLEKESLKNVAYDLVRIKEPQLKFLLMQTLIQNSNDQIFVNRFITENNYDVLSFEILEKSILFNEDINAQVCLFNNSKKMVGNFGTYKLTNTIEDPAKYLKNELEVIIEKSSFDYSEQLIGSIPIINKETILGHIVIIIPTSEQESKLKNVIGLFKNEKIGLTSSLDYGQLKIFKIQNEKVISVRPIDLSEKSKYDLLNVIKNENNEGWALVNIQGEKYQAFALKVKDAPNPHTIVVAKTEKKFTWNLSDFFKIFFIHSILILFISFLIITARIKYYSTMLYSFRAKLTIVLLLVSIIPLFMVSNYLRGIIDDNNELILRESLTEKALQLKKYLEERMIETNVDEKILFDKISHDYNVEYSIYKNNTLYYSSYNKLYSVGLFSPILKRSAYKNILDEKRTVCFGKETLVGNGSNSVYVYLSWLNGIYIIEINDLLNPVNVALSKFDLDVFLFGIFSFALVIIILISTLLSGQISLPIKKLIYATRSVASGDLSAEVNIKSKDEFKELSDGFNLMVRKIKESQSEIAQFEREEAWREMAKQVAHEIKNPLTPMKLSIQQLIASYNDNSPKFPQIFTKVTETVINQIETLKNIASEFSNFARMPLVNIEKIEVLKTIEEVINLFSEEKKSILLIKHNNIININADKDHFKRTLINLIRNSYQAAAKKIIVDVRLENSIVSIRVVDDGLGITDEVLPNIFLHNYTTKEKGMGLGLSMAQKFIASIAGTIEVEKTDNNGTTFLIKLPVA